MAEDDQTDGAERSAGELSLMALRGLHAGNIYARSPIVRAVIRAPTDADWSAISRRALAQAAELAGFAPGVAANPFQPSASATNVAEVFSGIAMALQRAAGADVSWWRATTTEASRDPVALFACQAPEPGLAAAQAAFILLRHAMDRLQPLPPSQIESLVRSVAAHARIYQDVMAIGAAERLQIPWEIVASTGYPMVALGHGKHRRLFWRHLTPQTSHTGIVVSTNKQLAGEVLRKAGLPVPTQRIAHDLPSALAAAREIGWPVVTKPTNTDLGIAVTTRISDEKTLALGFDEARRHGAVLVEKHIAGDHLRLLVFHGHCISVARQTPAHVVGNGVNTIPQLVADTNATRSAHLSAKGKKIKIDHAALDVLRRQSLSLDTIPAQGQTVFLRFHTNLSAGGTMENVTAETHPDIKRLAVSAAALLGVDIAGIDFITPDGTRSYHDVGGAIAEVNGNPGFIMGEPDHSIEDTVIGAYFPAPDRGRIPIIGLMHRNDTVVQCNLVGALLDEEVGSSVIATANAVKIGPALIAAGALDLVRRAVIAVSEPAAGSVVLAMTPASFAARGLGLDRIALAVAAPAWDGELDPAFFGLAALADRVVLPSHWLPAYCGRRRTPHEIWSITGPSTPDGATEPVNRIVCRVSRNEVEIQPIKGRSQIIKIPPGLRERELEVVLMLTGVSAALRIPVARLKRILESVLPPARTELE